MFVQHAVLYPRLIGNESIFLDLDQVFRFFEMVEINFRGRKTWNRFCLGIYVHIDRVLKNCYLDQIFFRMHIIYL